MLMKYASLSSWLVRSAVYTRTRAESAVQTLRYLDVFYMERFVR